LLSFQKSAPIQAHYTKHRPFFQQFSRCINYLSPGRRRKKTLFFVSKDPQMIREVIKLMEELNQGWKVITG